MKLRFAFRIGCLFCAVAGVTQAGYVSQVSVECSPGVYASASSATGSASVSCAGNPNIFAWVQASGNLLALEMNQPGYAHQWDTASVRLTDSLLVTASGVSGDGMIRIAGTLHAVATGDGWARVGYHAFGNVWPGLAGVEAGRPETVPFVWDLPMTFGEAEGIELELLGVISGRGSVDAAHTLTITIAGVFLADGVTPVPDFALETASGLRYGLNAGDPAAVPEPGTLAMMAGALAVLGGGRLFRRQQGAQ